jgi:OOP family OmpA-OmpF porin
MTKVMMAGLLLLAGSTAAAGAEPASPGWYFGIQGGLGSADIDKDALDESVVFLLDDLGLPVISGDSALDDEDTAWSVFAGYRFSQYFSAEVGYVSFGDVQYRASGIVDPAGPVSPLPLDLGLELTARGPTVAAVGSLPLGERFDVHARAGAFFSQVRALISASAGGSTDSDKQSESAVDYFVGAGLSAHLSPRVSLALDYALFKDVGEEDELGEADIDSVTLSVIFRP